MSFAQECLGQVTGYVWLWLDIVLPVSGFPDTRLVFKLPSMAQPLLHAHPRSQQTCGVVVLFKAQVLSREFPAFPYPIEASLHIGQAGSDQIVASFPADPVERDHDTIQNVQGEGAESSELFYTPTPKLTDDIHDLHRDTVNPVVDDLDDIDSPDLKPEFVGSLRLC